MISKIGETIINRQKYISLVNLLGIFEYSLTLVKYDLRITVFLHSDSDNEIELGNFVE